MSKLSSIGRLVALPASSLEDVVAQTLALDMDQVRADLVANSEQA